MHGFDLIRGQERALDLLTTLLSKGCIPHALIFTGIDGIGKQTAAKVFAMACNCGDPKPYPSSHPTAAPPRRVSPCGQCRNCRRIHTDHHPDVLQIRPSSNLIRIGVIRDLIQRLAFKPHETGQRVVVIAEAHHLNPEAGNALLKLLEEPPEGTLFILTARQNADLLPTIASRGQQIRFRPLSPDILAQLLMENEGLSGANAAAASALAEGSFSRARAMINDGWIPRRRWLATVISRLKNQPTATLLALAETLAAGKDQLPDALAWLLSWYRDLIVYRYRPDQILNRDLERPLHEAAAISDLQDGILGMKTVQRAQKALQENANPRLTMETLVLQLAAV